MAVNVAELKELELLADLMSSAAALSRDGTEPELERAVADFVAWRLSPQRSVASAGRPSSSSDGDPGPGAVRLVTPYGSVTVRVGGSSDRVADARRAVGWAADNWDQVKKVDGGPS